MRKVYLLVYSPSLGNRDQIKACLNSLEEVMTWRYDMPNSFYLITEYEAQDISDAVRKYFNKGRFLVSEISDNRQGWLSKDTWQFIKAKSTE